VRFDVLGPLVVTGSAGWIALPAGPSTAAVCWLVAHVGEPVSHAALATAMWPDASDAARVPAVLRGVRARLDDDSLEISSSHAVLRVGPDDIDALRFERALRRAAEHLALDAHDAAHAELDAALRLWRGEPYRELAGVVAAIPVVTRLAELRERALEDLFGLRLRGPVDYRLVAELRAEATRAPERPRLRRQLALALYRTGRQIEALSLVAALRAEADEHASTMYDAMLRHDGGLEAGEPLVP
jgi:DNA-binding SARP family transcriptional activator